MPDDRERLLNPSADDLNPEDFIDRSVETPKEVEDQIKELLEAAKPTSKSFSQIAVEKGLETPNDVGLVFTKSFFEINKGIKVKSIEELYPTDEELAEINQNFAKIPQSRSKYLMLRNIEPIGERGVIDSQGDKFSKEAEKELMEQAYNTPLLIDHDHNLSTALPVGMSMGGSIVGGKLKEKVFVPITEYNANIIEGLLNGTINKLSVGLLVRPEDRMCNSCMKSIYDYNCGHTPGGMDEKGQAVSVTIKHVERYLERSLVNVPARTGTSVGKSLTVDQFRKDILNLPPLGGEIGEAEVAQEINLEEDKNSPIATINNVNQTIEDSTLAKTAKAELPYDEIQPLERSAEAEKEVEEKEASAEEKEVEEKGAKEPLDDLEALKAKKPPAHEEPDGDEKSATSDSDAKSQTAKALIASEKEVFTKAVKEQTERVNKLLEVAAKQSEMIDKLANLQKELAETVKAAVEVTTEETLEKFVRIVAKASDVKKENEKVDFSNSDWITKHFGR